MTESVVSAVVFVSFAITYFVVGFKYWQQAAWNAYQKSLSTKADREKELAQWESVERIVKRSTPTPSLRDNPDWQAYKREAIRLYSVYPKFFDMRYEQSPSVAFREKFKPKPVKVMSRQEAAKTTLFVFFIWPAPLITQSVNSMANSIDKSVSKVFESVTQPPKEIKQQQRLEELRQQKIDNAAETDKLERELKVGPYREELEA